MKKGRIRLIKPNIYLLKTGRYQVEKRLWNPDRQTWKRVLKTLDSLPEAIAFLEALISKAKLGLWKPNKGDQSLDAVKPMTLGQLLEITLPFRKDKANFKGIELYRRDILDFFGAEMPVQDLDRHRVLNFQKWLKGLDKMEL